MIKNLDSPFYYGFLSSIMTYTFHVRNDGVISFFPKHILLEKNAWPLTTILCLLALFIYLYESEVDSDMVSFMASVFFLKGWERDVNFFVLLELSENFYVECTSFPVCLILKSLFMTKMFKHASITQMFCNVICVAFSSFSTSEVYKFCNFSCGEFCNKTTFQSRRI